MTNAWDEPESGMTFDEWRRDLFVRRPPPVALPPLDMAVVALPKPEWELVSFGVTRRRPLA